MILHHKKLYTIAMGLSLLPIIVHADVVFDGTLGAGEALPGPDFAVEARFGQQVGPNLFHSFESFNLNSTESATFTGPAEITHIISRVTGGQPSFIDGVLRSYVPNADLYFLNPQGIMFGPNAGINISGSLYTSTADYLKLGETGRFDVTTPSHSLLTVAPPSAFGFLEKIPASITVEGGLLVLPNEEMIDRMFKGEDVVSTTLSLVGGNITIKDGLILTYGNDIHLVSVASAGEVPLDPSQLTDETFAAYGKLSITNTADFNKGSFANLDVSGLGGGEVFIRAGEVVLDNGFIYADTWQNKAGQGITVHANEALTLKNGSRITTESLDYSTAKDPSVQGLNSSFTGHAGNISVSANDITLTEGSQIQSLSKTAGNAGNIAISAQNKLSLIGGVDNPIGRINSGVLSNTVSYGKGGDMQISAQHLVMEEGATIRGETWGLGDAGNVFINVDTFSLSKGAEVNVSAGFSGVAERWKEGTGKAGQLTVVAKDAVEISGASGEEGRKSGFLSNVFNHGQGGTIDITTPTLSVTEEGTIQAGSQRWGNAGNILLNVGSLKVSQNGLITAETLGDGLGGSVDIQANHVHLAENGAIKANSQAKGFAGNIKLTLTDKLTMNKGLLQTAAESADGGNIAITAQNYLYLVDSDISTSVGSGLGGGGNITMDQEFVVQDESPIIAEAHGGPGGNINIATTGIYKFSETSVKNRISASSQYGVDGIVEINSPVHNAMEDIALLGSDFLDVSGLLNTPCSQGIAEPLSSFVMLHSEGESNALTDLFPSGLFPLPPVNLRTSLNIDDSTAVSPNQLSMLVGCRNPLSFHGG
ncbi:MAG: filamentous hemagglutinin N-terminal domain-containing protein [Candidatus Parabeggiatoa sp.]|nr:filamentous hemagglutinin N-terminal domain-containing protein [Candidatus Parabeggiatoa sp.]